MLLGNEYIDAHFFPLSVHSNVHYDMVITHLSNFYQLL